MKLREAEANLSLKEMKHRVHDLEEEWQVCSKFSLVNLNFTSELFSDFVIPCETLLWRKFSYNSICSVICVFL